MKKRKIGGLYDKEKFHNAFEAAADAFVAGVMDGYADSEKGRETHATLVERMKKQLSDSPVEMYALFEAFVDGSDLMKNAEYHGSDEWLEYVKEQGACGIIDLLSSVEDGLWRVKDPTLAERYYDALFPAGQKGAVARDEKEMRAAALFEAKARIRRFDEEAKKLRSDRRRALEVINSEHAAFIEEKNIDKRDPAYRLLSGLYSEFKKEHRSLGKLEDLVMSTKRRLITYEALMERGVISERELEEHDILKGKEKMATMDLECYMNALDDLGEVRYRNGIVSERLYLMLTKEPQRASDKESEIGKEVSAGERIRLSLGKARRTDPAREAQTEKAPERDKGEPQR